MWLLRIWTYDGLLTEPATPMQGFVYLMLAASSKTAYMYLLRQMRSSVWEAIIECPNARKLTCPVDCGLESDFVNTSSLL